jgi:hypothetical protein
MVLVNNYFLNWPWDGLLYYTKKCITFKWCLSHRLSFIEPLLIIVTTCTSRNIDTWSLKFKITRCVTCLDLQLELDSGDQLRTKLYDKRDDLNFPIMNCSYLCSSFPSAARASGIYISQLIWYFRVRGYFKNALDRRFPTYMEATGPTVTSGQVKASLLKKVWRLCSPLRNIHVKDDQE